MFEIDYLYQLQWPAMIVTIVAAWTRIRVGRLRPDRAGD